MKPIAGYDLINEAGEFKRLPAGIYGVKITNVIDNPEKEYLEVYCDITKGEYAGYFKKMVDAGLQDASRSFRSYKQTALAFFKAFISAVEKTNPGYQWDWDEKKLIGKNVIAVVGEEEYRAQDGTVKTGIKVVEFRSLEAYQQGKIKVPEIKRLPVQEQPVPVQAEHTETIDITDDELPF